MLYTESTVELWNSGNGVEKHGGQRDIETRNRSALRASSSFIWSRHFIASVGVVSVVRVVGGYRKEEEEQTARYKKGAQIAQGHKTPDDSSCANFAATLDEDDDDAGVDAAAEEKGGDASSSSS